MYGTAARTNHLRVSRANLPRASPTPDIALAGVGVRRSWSRSARSAVGDRCLPPSFDRPPIWAWSAGGGAGIRVAAGVLGGRRASRSSLSTWGPASPKRCGRCPGHRDGHSGSLLCRLLCGTVLLDGRIGLMIGTVVVLISGVTSRSPVRDGSVQLLERRSPPGRIGIGSTSSSLGRIRITNPGHPQPSTGTASSPAPNAG